ncbi:MAG TPA: site-specific integrase [Sphingobium sp.]|nr:site-specific integrase [Sphingobium sp.]
MTASPLTKRLRPGELRQAEWAEIDVERAICSIPVEKMKMRRPHRVPLSRQVLAIIEELREITGHRQYLFPCMGSPRRPMSKNGVNQALRRLGYEAGEMTARGFRAMAATLLNEIASGIRTRSSGSLPTRTSRRFVVPMRAANIGTNVSP